MKNIIIYAISLEEHERK